MTFELLNFSKFYWEVYQTSSFCLTIWFHESIHRYLNRSKKYAIKSDSVDQFECFLRLNNFSDNSRMGFSIHSLPPDGAFMPKLVLRFWAYLGKPIYAQPLTFPNFLFCHLKVPNIRWLLSKKTFLDSVSFLVKIAFEKWAFFQKNVDLCPTMQ